MTVANICENKKSNCCGCYACENVCPANSITFSFDEEGFWYPEVDKSTCINCGRCVKVCPCINPPKSIPVKTTLACNAKDKVELMTSSSGGAFAVLARTVINQGGYVCGAAFDEDFSVIHKVIDSQSQIKELKGTKYVQSKIGTSYSEVKDLLTRNKLVLFSGTPCQVAGLKTFLGKDYDNLITIDLICHGVPSPMVWQEYLAEISDRKKLTSVNFRNKENGISSATMSFTFDNGTTLESAVSDNPYYIGFIKNYYLRPSCFECKFKGMKRCSDITIGDFWAVKEYYPEFDSQYGTSAVIIRTEKAHELFKSANTEFEKISVNANYLSVWNEHLMQSASATDMRIKFYLRDKDQNLSEYIEKLYDYHKSNKKRRTKISKIKDRISVFIKTSRIWGNK